MTLKRGTFRLVCDEPGCDEFVDLETEDFEEALVAKSPTNNEDTEGWSCYGKPGHNRGFLDYCPSHDPYGDRKRERQ